MFIIDVNELRGKIAARGLTLGKMADKVHISRNTMTSYMKYPDKIPYATMRQMADILQLNESESRRIFFASELTQTQDSPQTSA